MREKLEARGSGGEAENRLETGIFRGWTGDLASWREDSQGQKRLKRWGFEGGKRLEVRFFEENQAGWQGN
jgi:hypothetical protein